MQKDSCTFLEEREREREREKKTIQSYRYRLGNYLRLPNVFPFFPPRYTKKPDEKNTITIASSLLLKSIDRRNGSKSCLNTI